MEANINGIIIGMIIGFIFMMVGIILFKVFSRTKEGEGKIIDILTEYQDDLIEIAELCIELVSKNKDDIPRDQYNHEIMELTADYFRVFLRRETKIPKVLIDLITAEHMFDIIDYINTITDMKIKNAVSDQPPKKDEVIDEVIEDPYTAMYKKVDKMDNDELVDIFKNDENFF